MHRAAATHAPFTNSVLAIEDCVSPARTPRTFTVERQVTVIAMMSAMIAHERDTTTPVGTATRQPVTH